MLTSRNRNLSIIAVVVTIFGSASLVPVFCNLKMGRKVVFLASATSPDGKWKATLSEVGGLDRNLRLEVCASDGKSRVQFVSADEGKPGGGEALIWSEDSRYLLVVARNVFVEPSFAVGTSTAYALVDLQSNQVYCNSPQVNAPRFGFADIQVFVVPVKSTTRAAH